MPNPAFIPVIGGGFDQIAQQQMGWAGFNQRQDESNLRRAQMADEAANQWFTRYAQMQQEENARRDRLDQAQQESDRRNVEFGYQQQRDAERRREFDVSQKLAEAEFKWEKDAEDRTFTRDSEMVDDIGKTLAPMAKENGAAHEKSKKTLDDSTLEISTALADWSKQLPGGQWNNKSQKFEKTLLGRPIDWPPEQRDLANKASADIAEKLAQQRNAERDYKESLASWNSFLSKLPPNQLYPFKTEDGEWGLRSPITKKTYLAPAKSKSAVAQQWEPEDFQGFVPVTSTGSTMTDTQVNNRAVDIGKLAGLSMGTQGAIPFIPELAPREELTGLRVQALAAIKAGADPEAVRARFKKMTGRDLT